MRNIHTDSAVLGILRACEQQLTAAYRLLGETDLLLDADRAARLDPETGDSLLACLSDLEMRVESLAEALGVAPGVRLYPPASDT
jgi:hypothetical protein